MKLLLLDSQEIFAQGLQQLLVKTKKFTSILYETDGRRGLNSIISNKPDVVLSEIPLSSLNGIEILREISRLKLDTKVIFLSDTNNSQTLHSALKLGASGFIDKNCSFNEINIAINSTRHSTTYLSAKISTTLVKCIDTDKFKHPLSAREQTILKHLSNGLSIRDISNNLHISEKTIRAHKDNIMKKLKIGSFADLVKYAIMEGMTFPSITTSSRNS